MKARILVLLLAASVGCYQPTLSPQYPIVQGAGSGSASDGSAAGARKYGDGGQLTFGYLSRVAHGSELTGYGTTATPLSFTPCSSAGQGYQWNGSAFVCALFNSISGLTTNQTVKAASATSVANAWPADDATTWGVSNKFTIAEATGNTTIGGTSATSHFFLGNVAQYLISVKNTNGTGFSAIDYFDTSGVDHLGFGYSNLESISYLSLNSGDFKIGTTGNVQRVKIFASTGDVNVGPSTSDPGVLFNVQGTANATTVTGTTASGFTSITGTTVSGTNLTWSSGTTGSVMFLGASGAASQNNANFFWDNTNARLGLGTTGPANKLHVKASTSGLASAALEHSSTGGYAAIDFVDSAAATQGRIGYGNSAVAVTQLQGLLFFYSPNSKDIVFSNPTKNEIQFGMTDGSVYLMMQDGVSSSVSASGTGRLRYNNSSHTFQGSVNGGSWADLAGSSGGVTSVSGTAPIVSTGGTAPTISVNTFDSTHAGVVPASGGGTVNYMRADGNWAAPAGGGGGWSGAWASGSAPYATGSIVSEGPYIFGANSSTSVEPMVDFGNLGSSSDFVLHNISGTAATQTSTDDFGGGGYAKLVNNTTSTTNTAVSSLTMSGWAARRLVVDAEVSGTADAIMICLYDSSLGTTLTTGCNTTTGAWGVRLQFYSGSPPYVSNIVNGTENTGTKVSATNGGINNQWTDASHNTANPTRWAIDFIDNTSTMTIKLYREVEASAQGGNLDGGASSLSSTQMTSRRWALWASWTGLTRPSFSSVKAMVEGTAGGLTSILKFDHVFAVDTSGAWTALSEQPMWWIR